MRLSDSIRAVDADRRQLARFADRRERFLDALDWSLMTPEFCRLASMADEWLSDERAFAACCLDHLVSWFDHAGDVSITGAPRFTIPTTLLKNA